MDKPNWSPLRDALKLCRSSDVVPSFWWRDDDAIAPTGSLERLIGLADELTMDIHLAVIPAHATDDLAALCHSAPLVPVVHGWAHKDHSQGNEKKNEFLTPRSDLLVDAHKGKVRMSQMFGPGFAPMFVPPWNRIHPDVVTALPDLGFQVLSTFGPRKNEVPGQRIVQVNTHVDPIDWKGTRGLVQPDALIADAARALIDRAEGRADAAEPFGLLTHHLVHDEPIWAFARAFAKEMLEGGATLWKMERLS